MTEADRRDREKPALPALRPIARTGRRYGFCTLSSESERERRRRAVRPLLQTGRTWPQEDVPQGFDPEPGTTLYRDAQRLLANPSGNAAALNLLPGRHLDG